MNPYDILKERGFVYQATDETGVRRLFDSKRVTTYIGFDPTADSLHAGSLIPIMALAHIQRGGHRPIALVGGGTGMVGDPSGKTETRRLLHVNDIIRNAQSLKQQLARYISFDGDDALLLNNVEWLGDLKYIEFLRDIGRHFSVNKMLTAESIRQRLEKGLTFIEFNYMVLQAYDFYILNKKYDCDLQMGGQDQWGNIVAGIDLIRRINANNAYGVTFPLITDSNGQKFGKSVKGAVWLDQKKTAPYDYYQFFRNTMDSDVSRYLGYFTFLPIDEVNRLGMLTPPHLNRAKEILAFEATRITHGIQAAKRAWRASIEKFGESDPHHSVETSSEIMNIAPTAVEHPAVSLDKRQIVNGLSVIDAFVIAGLAVSKGEARRLIRQGGAYLNDMRITDESALIGSDQFANGEIQLRAGKKRYMKITLE